MLWKNCMLLLWLLNQALFMILAFTGLFDDAYRFAKRTKESRTDKIYEIRFA